MKRPSALIPACVVYAKDHDGLMDEMIRKNADVGFCETGEVVVFQRLEGGGKIVTQIPSTSDRTDLKERRQ